MFNPSANRPFCPLNTPAVVKNEPAKSLIVNGPPSSRSRRRADVVVFAAMVKPTKFPMYYLTANHYSTGIEDGLNAIKQIDNTIYRKIRA